MGWVFQEHLIKGVKYHGSCHYVPSCIVWLLYRHESWLRESWLKPINDSVLRIFLWWNCCVTAEDPLAFGGGMVYKQFNCVCHLENSSPYMNIFLNVFGSLNLVILMILEAILPSNNLSNMYKGLSRRNSHILLPTHLCFYIKSPTFTHMPVYFPFYIQKTFIKVVLVKRKIWHLHGG